MTDIDKFKSVNDTYGHDVGDEVIKAVAGILHASKRTTDIVGRLGGEEFAIVLPKATMVCAIAALFKSAGVSRTNDWSIFSWSNGRRFR